MYIENPNPISWDSETNELGMRFWKDCVGEDAIILKNSRIYTTPPLPYQQIWGLIAYLKGLFGLSSPYISPEAQGVFLALARLTESEMRDTAF